MPIETWTYDATVTDRYFGMAPTQDEPYPSGQQGKPHVLTMLRESTVGWWVIPGGGVASELRVMLEAGPKGKKVVAVAPDWPGLARGAKTSEAAIERLRDYLPRYAPVAALAELEAEFAPIATIKVVEEYPGTGSTDCWGISFAYSSIDRQEMSREELERQLALMQGGWAFFDQVRSCVSEQMRKGPRGGGRDRDDIVRHTVLCEQDWGPKLGLPGHNGSMPNEAELRAHRENYVQAIRAYRAEGKQARTWPLRYLIRHTAFHTLDHTWEMEDKDLGGQTARRQDGESA